MSRTTAADEPEPLVGGRGDELVVADPEGCAAGVLAVAAEVVDRLPPAGCVAPAECPELQPPTNATATATPAQASAGRV
ncbi:hypothetical protein [Flexivirga caeni]|uniref:hypothetical protein n=1 Tax=Flexivirga caeni TaxID=2294115 RepID=UPI0013156E48|nr:hypothetical protein [Flexivirga caeni]